MVDLSKWDYAVEFMLYEAAALIVGIDPAEIYTETKSANDNPRIYDYHEHPQIKPVVERMKLSFFSATELYTAMRVGGWNHSWGEPSPELVLRSSEMEVVPLTVGSSYLPLESATQETLNTWFDSDESIGIYETAKFSRAELSRWLSVNCLKSAYSFDLGLSKVTTPPNDLMSESGELAEMNTNKALAVMAWLLAENKPAMKIGGKPNAAQIGEAVAVMAKKAFGENIRGFHSFHKKIGNALKLLDGNPF